MSWMLLVCGLVLAAACSNRQEESTHEPPAAAASHASTSALRAATKLPTVSGTEFSSDSALIAPSDEHWPSEVFAERAANHLLRLKQALLPEHVLPENGNTTRLSNVVDSLFHLDFSVSASRSVPRPVFANDVITVRRQEPTEPWDHWEGKEAVSQFLAAILAAPSANQGPLAVKIVGVELRGSTAATTLRAESSWQSAQAAVQKTSRWECEWQLTSDLPRLVSARLQSLEVVERQGPPWLADATAAVIGHTAAFQNQIAYGLQHWLARIETAHGMNYFSKHGVAVADVNGDGLDDVYLCQPGGLPNRLFVQNDDGTAREQAAEFGLDVLDRTSSAVFADFDNDGDQDAAVATMMGVIIFENAGQPPFRKRQVVSFADLDLQGISAVDFDNDGDLDLYQLVDFASDASRARQGLPRFVYHDARDGGANRLLENTLRPGQPAMWEFRDVTDAVGLGENNQRHSLAAAWEDFDNDGDQDLYVANDYGPNCLYRNQAGQFQDVASSLGVIDFGSGMSVSWGDANRDGHMDLYVGNMFSSAGSRITTQSSFLSTVAAGNRQLYQRFAKGNSLFLNHGDTFLETSEEAGVQMGRWSWSSLFADMNNDGWEDVLVTNGYITTEDTGDL